MEFKQDIIKTEYESLVYWQVQNKEYSVFEPIFRGIEEVGRVINEPEVNINHDKNRGECKLYSKVKIREKYTKENNKLENVEILWGEDGPADKVLLKAFSFVIHKGGSDNIKDNFIKFIFENWDIFKNSFKKAMSTDKSDKSRNKFVQFLADDWQAFDKAMNKIFFKKG